MTDDSIGVGLLFSQTGVTSIVERTQLAAAQLAIIQINRNGGIGGRFLAPVIYDPASSSHLFCKYGKRLLDNDNVSVIFGCYMSSSRRSILPILESSNAVLCYPTFYEGFEYSENVIYFGSVPNQTNFALLDFMLDQHGERVFLIGSDYMFPRETNRLMRSILSTRGATILGEAYIPLGAPTHQFQRAIAQIEEANPDFIFSTIVGSDIQQLYSSFAESGMKATQCPIASVTTTEAELAGLPEGYALDHITAAPYFATLDTAANRRFVKSYQAEFGPDKPINMCAEAAYNSVISWVEGVRHAGGVQPRSVIRALGGLELGAPQGNIRLDSSNNHHFLHSRIGRARSNGQFDIMWESSDSVKPDPYLVESDQVDIIHETRLTGSADWDGR